MKQASEAGFNRHKPEAIGHRREAILVDQEATAYRLEKIGKWLEAM